jgi:outer membrane lipoprotein-sorting protein
MERKRMQRFLFGGVLIVAGLLSAAAGPSQEWTSLKEASRDIRSVKGEFLQKRYLQILTEPLRSEGRFFFSAPGSLRWEYLRPLRSLMLQKGEAVQLYHFTGGGWKPEMTQAVEARRMVLAEIREWLQGRFDESKVFTHLYFPGPPARVILAPKEGISRFIQRIEIVLSVKPGVIDRVEIEEPGGSRTSIEFRKVKINSSLPGEIFEKP